MCSEPGFGASVSGSRTTSGAGSRSRPRLWAARRWPRLRPLPHPLRFCAGTATSSQPSTMAARTGEPIVVHLVLDGGDISDRLQESLGVVPIVVYHFNP